MAKKLEGFACKSSPPVPPAPGKWRKTEGIQKVVNGTVEEDAGEFVNVWEEEGIVNPGYCIFPNPAPIV